MLTEIIKFLSDDNNSKKITAWLILANCKLLTIRESAKIEKTILQMAESFANSFDDPKYNSEFKSHLTKYFTNSCRQIKAKSINQWINSFISYKSITSKNSSQNVFLKLDKFVNDFTLDKNKYHLPDGFLDWIDEEEKFSEEETANYFLKNITPHHSQKVRFSLPQSQLDYANRTDRQRSKTAAQLNKERNELYNPWIYGLLSVSVLSPVTIHYNSPKSLQEIYNDAVAGDNISAMRLFYYLLSLPLTIGATYWAFSRYDAFKEHVKEYLIKPLAKQYHQHSQAFTLKIEENIDEKNTQSEFSFKLRTPLFQEETTTKTTDTNASLPHGSFWEQSKEEKNKNPHRTFNKKIVHFYPLRKATSLQVVKSSNNKTNNEDLVAANYYVKTTTAYERKIAGQIFTLPHGFQKNIAKEYLKSYLNIFKYGEKCRQSKGHNGFKILDSQTNKFGYSGELKFLGTKDRVFFKEMQDDQGNIIHEAVAYRKGLKK